MLAPLAAEYDRALRRAGRTMARRFEAGAQSLVAAEAAFVPPDGDEVLTADEVARDLQRRVRAVYEDLFYEVNLQYRAEGINFDIAATLPQETRELIGSRAVSQADAWLHDTYREVIVEAMQEGWSVPRTAAEIRTVIDDGASWRATAMARTDLIGAANSTSYLAALKTFEGRDDVRKQWIATNDERTRDTHREAHDQLRPLREPFTVGLSPLRYPGDPWGPDEEVINCRCTLVYTTEALSERRIEHVKPSRELFEKSFSNWTEDDIVSQNYDDLLAIDPDLPPGSYASGPLENIRRRDAAIAKWKEQVVATMETAFSSDDVQVAVRVDQDLIPKIAEDGRLLSQFESGSSRGLFDPEVRKRAELDMFSHPTNMPVEQRPIYGYLSGITDERGTVSGYGSVKLQLKNRVKERTTFASTDSLNSGVAPAPVLKPEITALYRSGIGSRIGLDKPLDQWDVVYWEAQIHGGVTLDDVEKVIVYYAELDYPGLPSPTEGTRRNIETANRTAERIRGQLSERGWNIPVEIRSDEIEQAAAKARADESVRRLLDASRAASVGGLAPDDVEVDAAGDVPPVASGKDGLNRKLLVDDAGGLVEHSTTSNGATALTLSEHQVGGLTSHGDGFHAEKDSPPTGVVRSSPMPWHVENTHQECPSDRPYAVVKNDDGAVEGCHATRAAADRQLAALYAQEEDMEAQTASTVTVTVTDGTPEQIEHAKPWEGVLAIVGAPTSDGRYLLPGEIEHRDLPIPFRVVLQEMEGGHEGARNVGSIDTIEFVPAGDFDQFELGELPETAVVVWATGMLDGSEGAQEAERVIANGAQISIDMPTTRSAAVDPETLEEVDLTGMDPMEAAMHLMTGEYLLGLAGKIAAATVVDVSAFEETKVRLTKTDAVVASAFHARVAETMNLMVIDHGLIAAAAPIAPPRDWFFVDEPDEPTPLTITKDGRVFGHIALWNTCHAGRQNGAYSQCMYAPHSPTQYRQFHLGSILCDDGGEVAIGRITVGTGHAALHLGASAARRHYDDTGTCAAYVRAKDGVFGIWVCGVARSDATAEQLRDLRACPPSGDWRSVDRQLELQAILAVNVPGYPVPRSQLALAASADHVGAMILAAPDEADYVEALRAEIHEGADLLVSLNEPDADF